MKKLLFCFALLLMLFTVTSCAMGGTTGSTPETVNVTFVLGNRSVTVPVEIGKMPTAPSELSYKTEDTVYTFLGWDKELTAANGDVTYTAQYTSEVRLYRITFMYGGESTTLELPYSVMPEEPLNCNYETDARVYTFVGWDKPIVAVTADATYSAQYTSTLKQYDVTFVYADTSETQRLDYGTMPTPPTELN